MNYLDALFVPLRRSPALGLLLTFLLALVLPLQAATSGKVSFDVPAGDAGKMLKLFAKQAQKEIIFPVKPLGGVNTNAVQGEYSVEEGLEKLTAGTTLSVRQDDKTGGLIVQRTDDPNAQRLAQKSSDQPSDQSKIENGVIKLETFEVMGTKLLNMDIRRTRDDAQPYVVFDRTVIEKAGASSLEEFLKQRLTMNTVAVTGSQFPSFNTGVSSINLRGLGTNQTLILIDGHRAPNIIISSTPSQPNINGIPLSSIERIEVLPTTAAGIYGGGATGGVINIILRRDYAGAELNLTYENTFESDAARRQMDLNAGFDLEGGKTRVLLAASFSDRNTLMTGDRDFQTRGRARILSNNPSFYLSSGTPPLGYTSNIRSADGSPLFGPGSSNITFVPVGYAGGGGLAPFLANAGKYNFDLAVTSEPGAAQYGLMNGNEMKSFMATIRRQFGKNVDAFLDLNYSNTDSFFPISSTFAQTYTVAANAPNNPFGKAIRVTVPGTSAQIIGNERSFTSTRSIVGGIIFSLPNEWKLETDYSWQRGLFNYAFDVGSINSSISAPISNGTFDILRDVNVAPIDYRPYVDLPTKQSAQAATTKEITLRSGGPIGTLLGEQMLLSSSVAMRATDFGDGYQFGPSPSSPVLYAPNLYLPGKSEESWSAYSEVKVPLVSKKSNRPGVRQLELQLAGRFEQYQIRGTPRNVALGASFSVLENTLRSFDPTIAIQYKPVEGISFRASYGTGFLPPSVVQLSPVTFTSNVFGITDPRRGNEFASQITSATFQGNPLLRPEESQNLSGGIILTPRFIEGLRLSVDYTRIHKTDNIYDGLNFLGNIGALEDAFPDRVKRGPVPPGDPYGVGPITLVDISLMNIAQAYVEAYDVALDWRHPISRAGVFDLSAMMTWQTHYQTQARATDPLIENVGFGSRNPLKFKGNLTAVWTMGQWSAGWTAYYFGPYSASTVASALLNQGGDGRISKQITHDIFVKYRFASSNMANERSATRWLSGAELTVGVQNVFNTRPEFDAGGGGALYSLYIDPRLAVYRVSLKTKF